MTSIIPFRMTAFLIWTLLYTFPIVSSSLRGGSAAGGRDVVEYISGTGSSFSVHEQVGFNKSLSIIEDTRHFNEQVDVKKQQYVHEHPPPPPTPRELVLEYFSKRQCILSKGATTTSIASSDQSLTQQEDEKEPPAWLNQFMIQIGVQKGGTKAMRSFLSESPQFLRGCSSTAGSVEFNYFNFNVTDKHKHNADDVNAPLPPMDQRVLQNHYAALIEGKCPVALEKLKVDPNLLYIDDSPLYMQDSDTIPQLLNCVMPKAKILAILRNPTDRAFSHYNFYLQNSGSRKWCTEHNFDEWVDINIQDLKTDGVLDATNEYEELLAWNRYNKRNDRMCRTFVTRGLYAIQILHYMLGLEAAGRIPTLDHNLMVVHSDDMKGNKRQAKYNQVMKFLGLNEHTLEQSATVHKTNYGHHQMTNETRAKLDEFYRPYNKRLYDLLQWDPVWEE